MAAPNCETSVDYRKRKSKGLFASLSTHYGVDKMQLYNPLYTRFFALSESNYNQIEFNHEWSLSSVLGGDRGTITRQGGTRTVPIFLKMAPLLCPHTFITGAYAGLDVEVLPTFTPNGAPTPLNKAQREMADPSNAAYIDAFFVYLSSMLRANTGFVHGLEYYGGFLGVKSEFALDICDDVEYLAESAFFLKGRGSLFAVRDYDFIFDADPLPELMLGDAICLQVDADLDDLPLLAPYTHDSSTLELEPEPEPELEPEPEPESESESESCSSRDSATDDDELTEWSEESDGSYNSDDEQVILHIKRFPVHVIAMERCENTMYSLVDQLDDKQWFAALFQVIATLLVYQRVFDFTHNDLHINNIMWVPTAKKWLLYTIDGRMYKVPTHGRIFKIIDFGRAIYRYDRQLFVGSSFQKGGEAAAQYNFGPCLNPDKPLVEPNPAFDLCRFAVSVFDIVINDFRSSHPKGTIANLINEWCCDDRGKNVLYKRNGDERYPEFKLYKMIARGVHAHTPQAQLQRPEFAAFLVTKLPKEKAGIIQLCNIDALPRLG